MKNIIQFSEKWWIYFIAALVIANSIWAGAYQVEEDEDGVFIIGFIIHGIAIAITFFLLLEGGELIDI